VVYKKGAEAIKEMIEKMQNEIDLVRMKEKVEEYTPWEGRRMV